ncbi:Trans-enoyl reductase mycC [Cladorrhinum samala]|uniref:Trans-enoyl reductase mycC n=1 Tax=Cladorrhinum samala TaxID=585594 RepID=A0AAV9HU15_9PEZI|nr:Trans-enoyl reductase mycC [Cladorrhinum samala]
MSPEAPLFQRALVQSSTSGVLALTETRPVPQPLPDQVLIRVAAVALNPCDWKMPTNFPCSGAGVGSDYSGTIVQVGSAVSVSPPLKIGDRVAGAVHASNCLNPQSGSFAEYLVVAADMLWRVPDSMSFSEAAAIGWCVLGTVGLATLHPRHLGLPGTPEQPFVAADEAKRPWALVYAGSTASGTMAIQILRLSGFRVVTTCSPANFSLVESYGAEKAFDYHSPSLAQDVRAYTRNNLAYVVDIIADANSLRQCYASIGRAGGRYVGFELVPDELAAAMGRKTVKASWVLGIRMSGSEIALDRGYGSAADPELQAWGVALFKRMEKLIWDGKIRPHPIQVDDKSGLDGVVAGVEKLRNREVSGMKLVYTFQSSILSD